MSFVRNSVDFISGVLVRNAGYRETGLQHELIKDAKDNFLGEIREEDGTYRVWKREKPSFPPKSRHRLFGNAEEIEDARRLAEQLRR